MRTSATFAVTCALTGAVHTPSLSDGLPITSAQMIEQGRAAVEEGAAVLHLHARNPIDGRPDPDPELYATFLPALAETGAVLNITTGGSTRMSMQDRLAAALRFEPELASLNLGSMNFVFSGAARKRERWQHDWERDYLLGSEDVIFSNTYRQIEATMRQLGDGCGTKFEFEAYDVGHLYTLAHFADKGVVRAPFFVQLVLGVVGGIGADLRHLLHLVDTADRLFGDQYELSAFGAGRHQLATATQALLLGANVRVGLEDSLFIGPGQLAPDNASQVAKVVAIARELYKTAATPDEVRQRLGLKGVDKTKVTT